MLNTDNSQGGVGEGGGRLVAMDNVPPAILSNITKDLFCPDCERTDLSKSDFYKRSAVPTGNNPKGRCEHGGHMPIANLPIFYYCSCETCKQAALSAFPSMFVKEKESDAS